MRMTIRPWLLAGILAAIPGPATPGAFAADDKPADASDPKTIDEAMARIEKVLGAYDSDDQLEWRLPIKSEHKQRPESGGSEILLVFDGMKVVSQPFREPESISFDEVWQWRRQVYDLADDGSKTLTRRQHSHNVTRYSLSLKSGVWLVNGTMLSNGVHDIIGKADYQGIVKWHPDGFEFVGDSGVDNYYGAGGSFILGKGYGSIRYIRDGDKLVIRTRVQGYHLATDPDGGLSIMPDFKRPIGSMFEMDYESEPSPPAAK